MRRLYRLRRYGLSPRDALIATIRAGGITLVLGAGVSIEAGVPNWRGLAVRVWQRALKATEFASPVADVDIEQVVQDPQLLPVIFELAEEQLGTEEFVEVLRSCIYESAKPRHSPGGASTLEIIAEIVTKDYLLGAKRRIARVVTFNADELLREALRPHRRVHDLGQFWRTMDHAVADFAVGRGEQPVPVFHVHGLLPRAGMFGADFSKHRLVFTDSQYWQSGTSQASLANRTMNAALADSHCIFIGLSMTDANLLRWLALRHNEITTDAEYRIAAIRETTRVEKDEARLPKQQAAAERERRREHVRRRLAGHFWIRAPGDDKTGLLSAFLRLRGVEAVEISGWGNGSLAELLSECFEDPP